MHVVILHMFKKIKTSFIILQAMAEINMITHFLASILNIKYNKKVRKLKNIYKQSFDIFYHIARYEIWMYSAILLYC